MIFMNDENVQVLTDEETLKLKFIFVVHFVLITLGFQGFWFPISFLFYNSVFIGALIWTLHQNTNGLAMRMAAAVNQFSIVFDIIVLSVYFPSDGRGNTFSAAVAIVNLILRPVSLAWFVHILDKSDPKEPLLGSQRDRYQDIEAQRA